ncbi:hypothetical protein SPBR_01091 [Sporothrix brasiliensis 5110]|uniref:Uncharacterized protein n=1 Tax=Sporothrix brasiliensis 5110 TaxID=1398154 RepID=A0A0C2IY01_9PEZI|nr:uncharacterized protein SPBR_01091 [Sporothrix brasiliensis 5110]KIH89907.1 hypothetical protein SPBR_01091 [Sporothrix brasiliensis 5110]
MFGRINPNPAGNSRRSRHGPTSGLTADGPASSAAAARPFSSCTASVINDIWAMRMASSPTPALECAVVGDGFGLAMAALYLGVNHDDYSLFKVPVGEYASMYGDVVLLQLAKAAFVLAIVVGAMRLVSGAVTLVLACTRKRGPRHHPY